MLELKVFGHTSAVRLARWFLCLPFLYVDPVRVRTGALYVDWGSVGDSFTERDSLDIENIMYDIKFLIVKQTV